MNHIDIMLPGNLDDLIPRQVSPNGRVLTAFSNHVSFIGLCTCQLRQHMYASGIIYNGAGHHTLPMHAKPVFITVRKHQWGISSEGRIDRPPEDGHRLEREFMRLVEHISTSCSGELMMARGECPAHVPSERSARRGAISKLSRKDITMVNILGSLQESVSPCV